MKKYGKKTLIYAAVTATIIEIFVYGTIAIIASSDSKGYASLFRLFFLYSSGNSIPYWQTPTAVYFLLTIGKIGETVILAIVASLSYSLITNHKIKILLPPRLVLRKRTTGPSANDLTLGVLIGNPEKFQLHEIKCSIQCYYTIEGMNTSNRKHNSEVILTRELRELNNYFRFSFDVSQIHETFWSNYLIAQKDPKAFSDDYIKVCVSGQSVDIGSFFYAERKYYISEIIVDLHNPEHDFWKRRYNRRKKEYIHYIDWSEFMAIHRASPTEEHCILSELKETIMNS